MSFSPPAAITQRRTVLRDKRSGSSFWAIAHESLTVFSYVSRRLLSGVLVFVLIWGRHPASNFVNCRLLRLFDAKFTCGNMLWEVYTSGTLCSPVGGCVSVELSEEKFPSKVTIGCNFGSREFVYRASLFEVRMTTCRRWRLNAKAASLVGWHESFLSSKVSLTFCDLEKVESCSSRVLELAVKLAKYRVFLCFPVFPGRFGASATCARRLCLELCHNASPTHGSFPQWPPSRPFGCVSKHHQASPVTWTAQAVKIPGIEVPRFLKA